MSVWEYPFSFSLQNRGNDHWWYFNWWYSWWFILCVNQTGMAMGCSDTCLNIISGCIYENISGWDCIWICRLTRLPCSMCVCVVVGGWSETLIQPFEGPKRTKRLNKGVFILSACMPLSWCIGLLLPSDSDSDWNYTITSRESPACPLQILGVLSFQSHVSPFLIITIVY